MLIKEETVKKFQPTQSTHIYRPSGIPKWDLLQRCETDFFPKGDGRTNCTLQDKMYLQVQDKNQLFALLLSAIYNAHKRKKLTDDERCRKPARISFPGHVKVFCNFFLTPGAPR